VFWEGEKKDIMLRKGYEGGKKKGGRMRANHGCEGRGRMCARKGMAQKGIDGKEKKLPTGPVGRGKEEGGRKKKRRRRKSETRYSEKEC